MGLLSQMPLVWAGCVWPEVDYLNHDVHYASKSCYQDGQRLILVSTGTALLGEPKAVACYSCVKASILYEDFFRIQYDFV